jgi:predicted transcriptional regulator
MVMAKERKGPKGEKPGEKYIRIPADLWERLAAFADAHDRSVSGEATWAIRQYVTEEEAKRKPED